jgi:hypothetical protein
MIQGLALSETRIGLSQSHLVCAFAFDIRLLGGDFGAISVA